MPTQSPRPNVPVLQSGETAATPVGDITFTRVEGDANSLPHWIDFEHDGSYYGHDLNWNVWRSDDGITWTQTGSLGAPKFAQIDSNSYVDAGDQTWTATEVHGTDSVPQLLRWDGTRFGTVDLPDLTEPDIPGLRPTQRSLKLTSLRRELAIIASTTYSIDVGDGFDFGEDIDTSAAQIAFVDDDTMNLVSSSNPNRNIGPDYDVVADQVEPGTVQFVSPEGTVVGRVGPWPGLDADQLRLRLTSDLSHTQILIGDAAGLNTIATPPDATIQALADLDGTLLALAYNRDHYIVEQFSLWSTDDLTTWTRIESPISDEVTPYEVDIVGNGNGVLLAALRETWFTADGQAWQQLEDTAYMGTFAADFGWVMAPDSTAAGDQSVDLAVSTDGVAWQHLEIDCPLPDSLGVPFANVVGNMIFISPVDWDDPDNRMICVGTISK